MRYCLAILLFVTNFAAPAQNIGSTLKLNRLPESINTSGKEENPMVSPAGNILLFYRNFDLYYSLKDSSNWTEAKRVISANTTPGYFFNRNSFDGNRLYQPFSTNNSEDNVEIRIVASDFDSGKLRLPRPIHMDFKMERDFLSGKRGQTISGAHFKEDRAFIILEGTIYKTVLKNGIWIEPIALPEYISKKVNNEGLKARDPITQDPVVIGDNGIIYATVERTVKGFKSITTSRIQYFSINTDGLWSLQTPLQFEGMSEKDNVKITSYSEHNRTLFCEWNGDIYTSKLPEFLQDQIKYQPIPSDLNNNATTKSVEIESIGNPLYHALIIGISNYKNNDQDLRNLDYPVHDAQLLKEALVDKYTFEEENVRLLENPNRSDFLNEFEELSKRIQADDNLLVFYAGHGIWDEDLEIGYWLAADATSTSKANWINNSTIKDYLAGLNTKHTLLISDACFSGSIFKTREVSNTLNNVGFYRIYKNKSRKAMTSGTLSTVPDKSVFLQYLLKELDENDDQYLPSGWLFHEIEKAVVNNTNNIPQYGTIQNTGDEGGDFIFIRKQ